MMLSMTIFGTISLFVRYLPLASGEIALFRSVIAALSIGLIFLFKKQKIRFRLRKEQMVLLFFSGLSLGINWILLFEAYRYTTVSTATLCYYFAPILVTFFSVFLFREKISKLQILCFLMSAAGLILITGVSDFQTNGAGILLGLGAAVFYASTVLLNKLIRDVTGLQRTFFQFIAAVLILTPYVMFSGGFHVFSLDGKGWIALLVLGLVHTGLAYCLYFAALTDLPGQQIAVLSYMDPLIAVLISVFFLSEPMTATQMAGGAGILIFSLLNEWEASRH